MNYTKPDAVVWIAIGDSVASTPGCIPPDLIANGWNWIRETRVAPEMAFLKRNSRFRNIAVMLHHPFGNWLRYPHLDQYDYAVAAGFERLFDNSWLEWGERDYRLVSYIGSHSTNYPGYYPSAKSTGIMYPETPIPVLADTVRRNLMPFKETGMGIVFDVGANMVVSSIYCEGAKRNYYRCQDALIWQIAMNMLDGDVGVEMLPRGKPTGMTRYFNEAYLGNDGYILERDYQLYHGDQWFKQPDKWREEMCAIGISPNLSHMKGNIYRLISCGSRDLYQYVESSRRIISDGHIPCYGYLNVAIKMGLDPRALA